MIGIPVGEPILIADQFNAHAVLAKDERSYDKTLGTRYVFGLDADLDSELLFCNGTFAAVINDPFKIATGTHLVVHCLGYTSTIQQIAKFPSTPFLGEEIRPDGHSCRSRFFLGASGPSVEYLFVPQGQSLPEEQSYSCRVGFVVGGEGILTHKPNASILSPGTAFVLQKYERFSITTHVNPLGVLFFNTDPRAHPKKGPSW